MTLPWVALVLPQAAREVEVEQAATASLAALTVRRMWRRLRGRTWSQAWRDSVGPAITEVVQTAQEATAATAAAYVAAVLAELDLPGEVPELNIAGLVGVAGDGRPVDTLLYGAVVQAAKAQYEPRFDDIAPAEVEAQVLAEAESYMDELVATILADTERAAEATSMAQMPGGGYVRMVEPGACSRCVILAGRFYKWNDGFERHPRCRCRHIPASEDVAGDLRTNPNLYFESLSREEQDEVFTTAGAEAIRMGADPAKVVNARRDMYRAQEFGVNQNGIYVATSRSSQGLLFTTEGATTRGQAFQSLNKRYLDPEGRIKTRISGGTRYSRATTVRLMPETILSLAATRDDALRMLRLHGYIL